MAALAWALWALTLVAFALVGWLDRLLAQAGRPDLALLTSDIPAYVLATLSATTVGALLASRRPRHPVGWLLLGLGLPVALSGAGHRLRQLRADGQAGVAPGGRLGGPLPRGQHPRRPLRPPVRPAADPDRVAALAPLALVGLGRRAARRRWRWSRRCSCRSTRPYQATPNPLDVPAPWPACCAPLSSRGLDRHRARAAGGGRVAAAALPPGPRGRAPAAALAGPGRGAGRGPAGGDGAGPGPGAAGLDRGRGPARLGLGGRAGADAAGHRGGHPSLPAVRP